MELLEKQYHDELEKEIQGMPYSASISETKQKSSDAVEEPQTRPNLDQIAEDTDNLSMAIMSRKKRRLYEAMKVTILNYVHLFYGIFCFSFSLSKTSSNSV